MRVSELSKLAKTRGCKVKPNGPGVWRIQRSKSNFTVITTADLKSTNAAKILSRYIPAEPGK